jgi:hypothetical protein
MCRREMKFTENNNGGGKRRGVPRCNGAKGDFPAEER